MLSKRELPPFILGICTFEKYKKWILGRARAHVKRDRKRGIKHATVSRYKIAIHRAVMASQGLCAYTRKKLDWSLIGTYDNLEARSSGAEYMRKFSRMPTVDHNGNEKDGIPKFQICSLAVNDAKSHMSEQNFIQLCRDVLGWRGKNKK